MRKKTDDFFSLRNCRSRPSQGVVLTALPFISPETKAKALASLRGFTAHDMTTVGVSVKWVVISNSC